LSDRTSPMIRAISRHRPDRLTFIIIISSTANVLLKIDPSVVIATRDYVDRKVLEELDKLDFKHSVLVATTAPIKLTGLQVIDDVAVPANVRVLVKDQRDAKENGLHLTAEGLWTRTQDADSSLEVTPGLFVHLEQGTKNGDSVWQLVADAPIVLDASDLRFEIVAGRSGIAAGTYRSTTVDKLGRVIAGTPGVLATAKANQLILLSGWSRWSVLVCRPWTPMTMPSAGMKRLKVMAMPQAVWQGQGQGQVLL
jgi:phage-related tail fiber protein